MVQKTCQEEERGRWTVEDRGRKRDTREDRGRKRDMRERLECEPLVTGMTRLVESSNHLPMQ